MCVMWKLEKRSRGGDGLSPDVDKEIVQSHGLGTAKSPHLTDEETEAQREVMPQLWSARQLGQSQVQNPSLWISRPSLAPALHVTPSSLPSGLRENSLSFVLIGGLLHLPFTWIGGCPDLSFTGIGGCPSGLCSDWSVFCDSSG